MRIPLLLCALAACDSSSPIQADARADAPPDTPPPFTPATCNGQPLTMRPSPMGPVFSFGPVTLNLQGTTLCLALDTRQVYAQTLFEAQTAIEPATSSSFLLAILSDSGALLKQGEETTYGTMPESVAYVGISVEPMQVVQVKLVARAKAAPAETWLRLSLIEQLD